MSVDVVIGIGNGFRRDDGVGLAVADEVAKRAIPGVLVVAAIGDPSAILDAWTDARLAVVVDAAMGEGLSPGGIRRWTPGEEAAEGVVSSHAIGLPEAYALGEALGRLPGRLVVLGVNVVDVSYGVGLTPAVAAAVPAAVESVFAELKRPR